MTTRHAYFNANNNMPANIDTAIIVRMWSDVVESDACFAFRNRRPGSDEETLWQSWRRAAGNQDRARYVEQHARLAMR